MISVPSTSNANKGIGVVFNTVVATGLIRVAVEETLDVDGMVLTRTVVEAARLRVVTEVVDTEAVLLGVKIEDPRKLGGLGDCGG